MKLFTAKSTSIRDDVRWMMVLFGVLVLFLIPAVIASKLGLSLYTALFATIAMTWGIMYMIAVTIFVCYDVIMEKEPQSRIKMPTLAGLGGGAIPVIAALTMPAWKTVMTYQALMHALIQTLFAVVIFSFLVFMYVRVRKVFL